MTPARTRLPVQKRTPIPKPINTVPRPRKYPLDTMAVGAWFFVADTDRNTLTPHVSKTGRALGRKFKTRMVYAKFIKAKEAWQLVDADTSGAVQGIGVWRVE